MLKLDISQQYGRIAMQIKPPAIQLETAPAQLNIETEAASVEISQSKGTLEIDASPFRYSIGFKNTTELGRDFAQEGQSTVLDTIGQIAIEGHRLGAIASGEPAVAAIAADSSYVEAPGITWASTSPPEITYTALPTQFETKQGYVRYNNQLGKVDLTLDWGKVTVNMGQMPDLQINVVGSRVNLNS